MPRRVTPALLLVAALSASALADRALLLSATADLAPAAAEGGARGTIELASHVRPRGPERARIAVTVTGLDATRSAQGVLPEFRLVLAPPAGAESDLGPLRVNARGEGRLRLSDAARLLGSRSLRRFEGGVAEIRRNGTPVLTAPMPRLAPEGAGTSTSVRRVFGRLDDVDRVRPSPGTWIVESVRDGAGVHADRVRVVSSRLDTMPSTAGVRPTYRVFLVDRTGGRSVQFGTMELERVFGAWFHLDQARTALPSGVATVEEFDEGRVEVRLSNNVTILRGFLPPLPSVADGPLPGRNALASGAEELAPSDGGPARALAAARRVVFPGRVSESFTLSAVDLDAAAGPFTVVAVHESATRTLLGTFTAAPDTGTAWMTASTAGGDTFPGGLTWLSGQDLEVRSAADVVVLAGKFPPIR